MSTKNWNRDGWAALDWATIEDAARNLYAAARAIDEAVGGGGGGLPPDELRGIATAARAAALRLQMIAEGYL